MKNLYTLIITSALFSIFLSSCNDKIDLVGERIDTAVVYGLLDQSDSVHMIKITRAFLGPGNSLEIAQIPDSSYFNQVDAQIEEIVNGSVTRTWNLYDTIITGKEQGTFYSPDQKVYAFATPTNAPLRTDARYNLTIDINNGEFQVTGSTELSEVIGTNTDGFNYSFKFALNQTEFRNQAITINVGDNVSLINTSIVIDYDEITPTQTLNRSFEWNLGDSEVSSNQSGIPMTAQGERFYEQITSNIDNLATPDVIKRNFTKISVKVVSGTEDLRQYMLVNEPSSGIAQNKPTFTNLEVTNGKKVVGIFSARHTHLVEHDFIIPSNPIPIRSLDFNSTRYLCTGALMSGYLFCSQHPNDVSQSWYCN